MSASRRQDIITALASALGNVSSFAGRVYGWKLIPTDLLEASQTPCVYYKDTGEKITNTHISPSQGRQEHRLEIEFLILCQGANADTTMRGLLKDFYAVFSTDLTLGKKFDWISDVSDEMEVEQESKTEAHALVKMSFVYLTNSFNY